MNLEIGKFTGCLRYNRIGIDFFLYFKSIFGLPPGNPLEATLHMTEETWLPQVDHISSLQVDNVCPKCSIADVAGVFNEAQLDEPNTLPKSSTHHDAKLDGGGGAWLKLNEGAVAGGA